MPIVLQLETAPSKRGIDWANLLPLAVSVWGLCVLSNLCCCLLHEVIGHGLTAWVMGGYFYGFQVTGFNGSSASGPPPNASTFQQIFQLAAGNGSEIVAGFIALSAQSYLRLRTEARLILLIIGSVSLVGAFNSFIGGMLDGSGDAASIVALMNGSVVAKGFFLITGTIGLMVVPVYAFRRFLCLSAHFLPLHTFRARISLLSFVVGLPLASVILLFPTFPVSAQVQIALKLVLVSVLVFVLAAISRRAVDVPSAHARFSPVFAMIVVALAFGLLLATYLWLSRGIYFGR